MSEEKAKEGEAAEGEEEKDQFPNLTPEMREEVDECFDIFDKDKDNLISYYDLTMLLRWLKFNPTEKEMQAYIEEYDQAKLQAVNKKTVLAIVNKRILEPDTIEELIEAMKILDTNRDGTIATNELRWAMTKLGDSMDEASVDEMLKEIDGDKGYVEILEFAKVCFNIKEKKGKGD